MSNATKTCRMCNQVLSLNKFGRRSDCGKWSYRNECKKCISEKQRQYRKNRGMSKTDKERRYEKNRQLKYKFGITLDEYEMILVQQGGGCAICGRTNRDNQQLSVDHDHKTGEIRGLLCTPCNLILGHTDDSPDRLRQMICYLTKE